MGNVWDDALKKIAKEKYSNKICAKTIGTQETLPISI